MSDCHSICVKGSRHYNKSPMHCPKLVLHRGTPDYFGLTWPPSRLVRDRSLDMQFVEKLRHSETHLLAEIFPGALGTGISEPLRLLPSKIPYSFVRKPHQHCNLWRKGGNKKSQGTDSMCSFQPISADHDPTFAFSRPITANQLNSLDLRAWPALIGQ